MAKPTTRIAALQFAAALAVTAVLGRAAQLQVIEGAEFAKKAGDVRMKHEVLPARRGAIFDRNGTPLAITQQFYHLDVAPNEFTDTAKALRALGAVVGQGPAEIRAVLRKRYSYFHGPYAASLVEPLRGMKGIHLQPEYLRAYPSRDLAALIVGRLAPDTTVSNSGIELALDTVLAGTPGEAEVLKSVSGALYDSPARRIREPKPGSDVYLTLDAELQDIAERGLDAAIEQYGAEGGDVVMLDPRTGEVLALAARQGGSASGGAETAVRPSFFTDTYEPGSTAKLFTAAALLMLHRVTPKDGVPGHGGTYAIPLPNGRVRTIKDEHAKAGLLTLEDAIHYSSNVAMAQFSQRLSPAEQFDMLRAFGFGTPTGVDFPSESPGGLRALKYWTRQESQPSVAMGYEFAVTPIQLASAYGAIANGGILLTPAIVREVRDAAGTPRFRHAPEPVRRVLTPEVAATLREYLKAAVSAGGTGTQASLSTYELVGKTGTATKVVNGRYDNSKNTASFAAIFPKDHPQLVIVTKVDAPTVGRGFGGLIAAPATRQMIEQALAARQVAIDRGPLARGADSAAGDHAEAAAPAAPPSAEPVPRAVVPVPLAPEAPAAAVSVEVPDVAGRSVRSAALALHRRGFRVALFGTGRVTGTSPAAGTSAASGTLVTLRTE